MLEWLERRFGEHWLVLFERLRAALLRARGARLGRRVRIGARCVVKRPWCLQVGAGAHFEHQVHLKLTSDGAQLRLGSDVFVGCNSEFDVSSSVEVGDGVLIAPGCFITDHNHAHAHGRAIAEQGIVEAPVVVEEGAWLGAQVVLLPGVRIGRGAIVAGVPARQIGSRSAPP